MKQKWQDKIHNHEFPLQESDWEAMQKRIVEGAPTKRKPFGLFFNIKNLIVMSSIIILIVALWQWAQSPTPTLPKSEGETQSVRALNDAIAPKTIASTTENNKFSTVLPFRGRGLGSELEQKENFAPSEVFLNDSLSLPFSEKINLGLLQQ
ncbi:MAG: hypothetical protein ACKVTZ_22295, partial [Bacteroidia bacterium]